MNAEVVNSDVVVVSFSGTRLRRDPWEGQKECRHISHISLLSISYNQLPASRQRRHFDYNSGLDSLTGIRIKQLLQIPFRSVLHPSWLHPPPTTAI